MIITLCAETTPEYVRVWVNEEEVIYRLAGPGTEVSIPMEDHEVVAIEVLENVTER